jgi:hypothetical protein
MPNEPGNISEIKKELSEQYRAFTQYYKYLQKHIQLKMLNKIILILDSIPLIFHSALS